MSQKDRRTPRVVIIGAGPAGLTAALEITRQSAIKPVVLESLSDVGGISRTINYKGNRMDIGGHRFFSKSDWVMDWWRRILPVAPEQTAEGLSVVPREDRYLLVRSRLSRIYFLRKFFDYPISLSANTIRNLGMVRLVRIGISYLLACLFPRRTEGNLEDFLVNRFGWELYRTFFRSYTEKVWGVPCREISAAWGAQRIKGLSVMKALSHAVRKLVKGGSRSIEQQGINTSLIGRFLYPKLGPGQMWQVVAEKVRAAGGEIRHGITVEGLEQHHGRITAVRARGSDGREQMIPCDYLISTMPLRDLVLGIDPPAPAEVRKVAQGLCYRDFITVGLLMRRFRPRSEAVASHPGHLLPDN